MPLLSPQTYLQTKSDPDEEKEPFFPPQDASLDNTLNPERGIWQSKFPPSVHTMIFPPVSKETSRVSLLQMIRFFFLHHSQLDRLWWKWQNRKSLERLSEYKGKAKSDSEDAASLSDVLPMGGFAHDMRVSDVMNTESDLLCYRYA
ncbi:hypothetical protein BGZ57DRAFT_927509 [Hyaloscypha finlandica]|nr:hypothetical protein BGZ57DRAFT_927509 [Hyaloscypha finlandica]